MADNLYPFYTTAAAGSGPLLATKEVSAGVHILKTTAVSQTGTASNVLGAGTDRSGSITTGGTAQVMAASNTNRIALVGQNIDAAEDMWINEVGGTATANTIGSTLVPAKATFSVDTNRAISVVAATTGHKWTAVEL